MHSSVSLEDVFANKALQSAMIKTEKMNAVAASIKTYVQALPNIDPANLPELRNRYNPTIKATGPYVEPLTGLTYSGQVKEGIADGWGKVVTKQGDFLEGFFIEGRLELYCRQLSRKGRYYEGGIKNGHRHGKGSLVDATRVRIECFWEMGTPTGLTKIFDKHNTLLFEGQSQNGLLSGENCYYRDKVRGFEYRGSFSNGKINGRGTKKLKNNETYEGEFVDGLENGEGTLTQSNGIVIKGRFVDGKPEGECVRIHLDGTKDSLTIIDGAIKSPLQILVSPVLSYKDSS